MNRGVLLDRASGSVKPRGARPPHPHAVRVVLRIVWVLSVALTGAPALANWLRGANSPAPHTLPYLLVNVGHLLDAWHVAIPLRLIAAMLSALLACEVVLQATLRWWHGRATLRAAGTADQRQVYRVRVPRQVANQSRSRATSPSDDLFRALAAAMPVHGLRWGRAPHVALTLVGEPDQATTLQYVIAGGTAQQRDRLAATLRATIKGHQHEASIDAIVDPLHACVCAGRSRILAWQSYHLKLPPHYPLRLHDDSEHTDILGPLVTALEPGVDEQLTELQLVVQPQRGVISSFLHIGWRGHATALKLRLQAKDDFALADDSAAIERKLAGAPFYVTLRAVVVATQREAGEAALVRIAAALGSYESRTSHLVQRLVAERMHVVEFGDETI